MKLVEFKKSSGKCKALVESARIQHAEDLILFHGHQGALKAIDMLKNIASGKQGVSIKWDGSPAVVFGNNPNNEFIFTDKAGFNAKNYDGKSTNADDLESMIMSRAKDPAKRKSYAQYSMKMKQAFPTVQQSMPDNFQGYFVGDMLYFQQPQKEGNRFVFKPNVVEYSVDANSDIGKRIANSKVGVVLHHVINEQGTISPLKDTNLFKDSGLLALPPTTKTHPGNVDTSMLQSADAEVRKNAGAIDMFLNKGKLQELKLTDLPNILYTYVNSKVDTGLDNLGKDFGQWLDNSTVSAPKKARVKEYIIRNKTGFDAVFRTIATVMETKDMLVDQLDATESDIIATIDGEKGGEGYVAGAGGDSMKLVKRSGFTRANRAINR
tara:strand:+ start:4174 stop:5313 length:1140 start_codon:yes stop_codon:yes gene_type:complete